MRPKCPPRVRDALDQLLLDHEQIRKLLRQYDQLRLTDEPGAEGRAERVDELCDALSLLAHLEEGVFYPAVRRVLGRTASAQATFCDHARLRDLIAQLDEMPPGDRACDAVVADMGDCVLPWMNAAPVELFVAVRLAGLDTLALGREMALRRREPPTKRLKPVPGPTGSTWLAASGWPQPGRLASG